jgi:hypothetical protein
MGLIFVEEEEELCSSPLALFANEFFAVLEPAPFPLLPKPIL